MFDADLEDNDPSALLYFEEAINSPLKELFSGLMPAYNITGIKEASKLLKRISNDHKTKYCTHCKMRNHSTDECFKKKKRPFTQQNQKSVQCHNCKEFGHYANKCPKKRKTDSRTPLERMQCYKCRSYGHIARNCPQSINVVSNQSSGNEVLVPLKLNEEYFEALLDTGADMTCIDSCVAKKLDLDVEVYEGEVNFAGCSAGPVNCAMVVVSCGNNSFPAQVLVFDLVNNRKVLLGRDLLSVFGIEIRGIPLPFSVPNTCDEEVVNPSRDDPAEDLESLAKLKDEIQSLLDINDNIDRADLCKLPYAEIEFNTGEAAPVCRRQYMIPYKMIPLVKEKIQSWLDIGTITFASVDSLWNSPLIVVPKKDSTGNYSAIRLCLDTRGLNAILEDRNFTLPLIKDIFDRISGFEFASRLDLADSFNQLPIKQSHRIKTTFTFNGTRYMFNGAPFGVKTLTSELQRILAVLLEPFKDFCIHFVDDIVVFSSSLRLHIHHVSLVVQALNEANFKLRVEKCLFARKVIELLGYVIEKNVIKPDPNKLSSFAKLDVPTTGKALESFLGITSYLRDFIPCYSVIAAPLESIRKTKGSLAKVWNPECDDAFENFKKVLSNPPVLSSPDFAHEFSVGTDASHYGVGGVLYQVIDGITKYISFVSCALSVSQRNYPITKKELYAIVFCLDRFRQWLWGIHFTLYTDHMSLVYMFSKCKENRMIGNWADKLLEFFQRPLLWAW
uniref:RNA-directed DNA polymerase n=1 Tax=Vannella robusta TaxID=1487602 RepID=A0A7S4HQ34_9EUKA|mmetsp:Transcript_14070/g.17739  ORF Transcript_14070/g.17739 Transcript_14070/m.17739 type:complete len:729 (+) Transcript_14070:221-2407(+)